LTSNGASAPTWQDNANGLAITDDTTTNSTRYLTFTSATSGSITGANVSSTQLAFNPSSGSLGIGTSSPLGKLDSSWGGRTAGQVPAILVGANSDSSTRSDNTQKMGIIGAAHYTNAQSPVGLISSNSYASNNDVYVGGGFAGSSAATTVSFWTAANSTTTQGTERMRITSAGDVGIGTSSPANKLHVVTNSTTATAKGLTLTNTAVSTGSGQVEIDFITDQVDGSTLTNKARITASLDGDNPALGYLAFSTRNSTIQERMRITSAGNVGIGTASPSAKLHLSVGAATENVTLLTGSTTSATYTQYANSGGSFYVGIDNSAGSSFGSAYSANLYYGGGYPMLFWTGGTERMRIGASGDVCLGTTNNDPSGNSVNGFAYNAGANAVTANKVGGTTFFIGRSSTTGTIIQFRYNGADQGTISTNGSSTAYNTSSDYRLKENIAPMTGALATVAQLKPVTYKWKSTGEESQGFIAHELQAVVPECVSGEKDAVDKEGKPVYQGVDTSFLVATLTAAIQELKTELDSVKAELQTLKGN